jgi:hypothetical protein
MFGEQHFCRTGVVHAFGEDSGGPGAAVIEDFNLASGQQPGMSDYGIRIKPVVVHLNSLKSAPGWARKPHLPVETHRMPTGRKLRAVSRESRLVDVQTRRSARLIGIGSVRLTGTTAAQQEEESQAVQPGQMLKRHRSRRHGPAAYWSGGTGS